MSWQKECENNLAQGGLLEDRLGRTDRWTDQWVEERQSGMWAGRFKTGGMQRTSNALNKPILF